LFHAIKLLLAFEIKTIFATKNMKIYSLLLLVLFASCGSKRIDKQFCNCLKAGNNLNKKTASILTENVTQEDKIQIIRLKGEKERACENYKAAAGPEMREKMRNCFEQ
jgi:hypothetical protein